MHLRLLISTFVLALIPLSPATAQEKNLLFFGNSFTIGNGAWNVPTVVKDIAVAAGHPMPTVVMQANGGWTYTDHINYINSSGAAGPLNSLAAGQTWDAFVMQDYSTRPTTATVAGADLAGHRADAVTLAGKVLTHSPAAAPVLFETWARSPGHSYYPGTYASPAAMQLQLRNGYALSSGDVDAAYGAGLSAVAPVGDAFEAYGWSSLYGSDLYHASNYGSLLAGMVLYSTIYDQSLSQVNLAPLMLSMGLSSSLESSLKAAAGAVVPEPASLGLIGLAALAGLRRRRAA